MKFYGIFGAYDNGEPYEDRCDVSNVNYGYYATVDSAKAALAALTDEEVNKEALKYDAGYRLREEYCAVPMRRVWSSEPNEYAVATAIIEIRELEMND